MKDKAITAHNERLLNIKESIDELFGDTNVPRYKTQDSLEEIRSHIGMLLTTLEDTDEDED